MTDMKTYVVWANPLIVYLVACSGRNEAIRRAAKKDGVEDYYHAEKSGYWRARLVKSTDNTDSMILA